MPKGFQHPTAFVDLIYLKRPKRSARRCTVRLRRDTKNRLTILFATIAEMSLRPSASSKCKAQRHSGSLEYTFSKCHDPLMVSC